MAKILVVDDDPDLALAARLILQEGGYAVVEAHSSKEALDTLVRENPDLIVLDVMMDTTTAGFQLALTLRSPDPDSQYKAYQNIPIIMLTAIHETTNIRFGPDEHYLPVEAFLDKPVEPISFLKKVGELLAIRAAH